MINGIAEVGANNPNDFLVGKSLASVVNEPLSIGQQEKGTRHPCRFMSSGSQEAAGGPLQKHMLSIGQKFVY